MSTQRVTWWHFSDLHWDAEPISERLQFMEHLLKALQKQILSQHPAPDFVAFTGDIASHGEKAEYESAADAFFGPLARILESHGEPPILFVPGNHDLDRRYAANLNASRITGLNHLDQVDELLADEQTRDMYLSPFSNYAQFAEQLSSDVANPLSWAKSLDIGDFGIELHGINSAWASNYFIEAERVSDKGNLILGADQLLAGGRGDDGDDDRLRILLMHHPLDWINTELCSRVEQQLTSTFDVVLTGHVHSPRNLRLVTYSESRCLLIPCPVLYDRPYSDSLEFARGMSVGEFIPETSTCKVYLYRYSNVRTPKLLPYSEVYRTDEECFEVKLSRRGVGSPQSATSRFIDVIGQDQAAGLAQDYHGAASTSTENTHTLDIFRRLIEAQDQIDSLPVLNTSEAARIAYRLASLVIVRRDLGLRDRRTSAHAREAMLADLSDLRSDLHETSAEDLSALQQLIPMVTLSGPLDVSRLGNLNRCPTTLLYLVLWGLAQCALMLDQPNLIPGFDEEAVEVEAGAGNVLSVDTNQSKSEIVARVGTRTRSGFHRIAEARHAIDLYMAQVEDIWRDAALIVPPIRVTVTFPLWLDRSLESHYLRVDPKPITRLLMGKALYGGREHIWLRELVQNAIDATAMRRQISAESANYRPSVTVEWVNEHVIEIQDNGVGMALPQILTYLVTLGRSGWRSLDVREDEKRADASLFGRFGIGFASVFGSATAVRVWTRAFDTRSVDGIAVTFSSPDRPFFIEPVICEEGTRIQVELSHALKLEEFRARLRESFVYLPTSVKVSPDVAIPSDLESASTFHPKNNEEDAWQEISGTVEAELGSARVRIHTQLILPTRQREGRSIAPTLRPATRLTFTVDGVLVSTKDGLRLIDSTKLSPYAKSHDNLGLRGCYVTVDFDRATAPVLASRNDLELPEGVEDEFRDVLEKQIASLIPCFDQIGSVEGKSGQQRNAAIVRMLDFMTDSSVQAWGSREGLNRSKVIQQALSMFYLRECPVAVRSRSISDWALLGDMDPERCFTVVRENLVDHPIFAVYARSRDLHSWMVVSDGREMSVLADAWPHEQRLVEIRDTTGLFATDLMPEVRDSQLVPLLRGDYALSNSPLFQEALFVQLPGGSVPRHVGASSRRSEMPSHQRPRVFINSRHPLVVMLGQYLSSCDDDERRQVSQWFDSFCDGVVEDKSKLAPVARWTTLRRDLGSITGVDVSAIEVERLQP